MSSHSTFIEHADFSHDLLFFARLDTTDLTYYSCPSLSVLTHTPLIVCPHIPTSLVPCSSHSTFIEHADFSHDLLFFARLDTDDSFGPDVLPEIHRQFLQSQLPLAILSPFYGNLWLVISIISYTLYLHTPLSQLPLAILSPFYGNLWLVLCNILYTLYRILSPLSITALENTRSSTLSNTSCHSHPVLNPILHSNHNITNPNPTTTS